jgi:hypothetical protein
MSRRFIGTWKGQPIYEGTPADVLLDVIEWQAKTMALIEAEREAPEIRARARALAALTAPPPRLDDGGSPWLMWAAAAGAVSVVFGIAMGWVGP